MDSKLCVSNSCSSHVAMPCSVDGALDMQANWSQVVLAIREISEDCLGSRPLTLSNVWADNHKKQGIASKNTGGVRVTSSTSFMRFFCWLVAASGFKVWRISAESGTSGIGTGHPSGQPTVGCDVEGTD